MEDKINEAEVNFKRGNYEQSLRLYEEIVRADTQNAMAYQGASLSSLSLGEFHKAFELSMRALEIDSSLFFPHIVLALVHSEFGNLEKSRLEANIAMSMNPTSPDALCCLGIISLSEGNLDDAMLYLEKAVKLDPTNYLTQYNLAVAYQNKGDPKLFGQSVTLLRLKPNLKKVVQVLHLSLRMHRPFYLLLLILSGLTTLLFGPNTILAVTILLVSAYVGTGLFIAFGAKEKRLKELAVNAQIAIPIVIIGIIMYLWALLFLR